MNNNKENPAWKMEGPREIKLDPNLSQGAEEKDIHNSSVEITPRSKTAYSIKSNFDGVREVKSSIEIAVNPRKANRHRFEGFREVTTAESET